MKQYTFQELNITTGAALSWCQGNTNNALILDDSLTVYPFDIQNVPSVAVEERREKVLIKVASDKTASTFYLLMQAGEVRCFRDNRFEINIELLDVLRDNSIQYEVIQ